MKLELFHNDNGQWMVGKVQYARPPLIVGKPLAQPKAFMATPVAVTTSREAAEAALRLLSL